MLSTAQLRYEDLGARIEASYIGESSAQLVDALRAGYAAHSGRPRRDLEAALRDLAGVAAADLDRAKLVAGLCKVLDEAVRFEVRSPIDPRAVRTAVFERAAASSALERSRVFVEAADSLGLWGVSLEPLLYADLRGARIVTCENPLPSVDEIIGRYNFRLAQGLLLHADLVRVHFDSHPRAIYRLAKLNGLIVTVEGAANAAAEDSVFEVTGPLSLFQHTLKYGRALASFLPACALSHHFRVEARLSLRGKRRSFVLTEADPVLSPHRAPRVFDSALEAHFLRDFSALNSVWRVRREAELLRAGSTVFFPDFTFDTPLKPGLRAHVEIVGFWTSEYIARKLEIMESFADRGVIFCVDETLCCDKTANAAHCIRFSRRVPARAVLEALERF